MVDGGPTFDGDILPKMTILKPHVGIDCTIIANDGSLQRVRRRSKDRWIRYLFEKLLTGCKCNAMKHAAQNDLQWNK